MRIVLEIGLGHGIVIIFRRFVQNLLDILSEFFEIHLHHQEVIDYHVVTSPSYSNMHSFLNSKI